MVLQTTVKLIQKPGQTYPLKDDIFDVQTKEIDLNGLINHLKDGEVLVKSRYISIDAAMRVWINGVKTYMDPVLPGETMVGQQIFEVISSKDKKFVIGDIGSGLLPWQNYSIISAKKAQKLPSGYPNPSHFLGILGISGLTAYFGTFDIGKIQKGETVVVSAAAGAAGSIAVQLAKDHGCYVIGIAGSEDKCQYVIQSLKADLCINYKKDNIKKFLKEKVPQGVDVYFDNVGGQILDDVLMNINEKARIIMCGAISQYNTKTPYGIKNYMRLIMKRGTMQGFIVLDYAKRYKEAIQFLGQRVMEGKFHLKEDFVYGMENAPKGLQKLLLGNNDGKVIIDSGSDQIKPKL